VVVINIDEKRELILEADSHVLVLGGPGSGKTTIGLLKANHRLKNLKSNEEVLFLSFSRSAVSQIFATAKEQISIAQRKRIVVDTYHSFFLRIIRSYSGFAGLTMLPSVLPPEDSIVMKSLAGEKDWGTKRRELAYNSGKIDFDLFVDIALKILKNQPKLCEIISSRYPLIIIDEFQDTNDGEYEFIRLIASCSQVICLADPNQRIYEWRDGASPSRIQEFNSDLSPLTIDLKDENHRSPEATIAAFGRAILKGSKYDYSSKYVKVETYNFENQAIVKLKFAVVGVFNKMRQDLLLRHPTVAIVAATNEKVSEISKGFLKLTPKANFSIAHRVELDHNMMMHAWRIMANLLEAKVYSEDTLILSVLSNCADYYMSSSRKKDIRQGNRIKNCVNELQLGRKVEEKFLDALIPLLRSIVTMKQSGSILDDMELTLGALERGKLKELKPICSMLSVRFPFEQDVQVVKSLQAAFAQHDYYKGALKMLKKSAAMVRMNGGTHTRSGCTLMTLHKCKGREYDAILIYDGSKAPHQVIGHKDKKPYLSSRRLLQVAVTRARNYVYFLTPKSNPCGLLPLKLP